jgi:hypothetical protein
MKKVAKSALKNAQAKVKIVKVGDSHRVYYDGYDATVTVAYVLELPVDKEGIMCNPAQLIREVGKASPAAQSIDYVEE